jgi:hypothetical protein
LANMELEMRMASANDMLFIASNDAEIQDLIEGTRNLARIPASGPTGRLVVDLSAFMQNLKSLAPAGQSSPTPPEDLGKISVQFDTKEGRLSTRTSFDIGLIQKLISTIQAAVQSNAPNNAEGAGTL